MHHTYIYTYIHTYIYIYIYIYIHLVISRYQVICPFWLIRCYEVGIIDRGKRNNCFHIFIKLALKSVGEDLGSNHCICFNFWCLIIVTIFLIITWFCDLYLYIHITYIYINHNVYISRIIERYYKIYTYITPIFLYILYCYNIQNIYIYISVYTYIIHTW